MEELEEEVIDDVLNWKYPSRTFWTPYTAQELTAMLVETRQGNKDWIAAWEADCARLKMIVALCEQQGMPLQPEANDGS